MRGRGDGIVGRERELAALRGWLEAAREGAGRLVLCAGEPGIGKTRLAQELAGVALAGGTAVAWGRCAETEGAPAYWPWRQVLRSLGVDPDVVLAGRDESPEDRFRVLERADGQMSTAMSHPADAPRRRRPLRSCCGRSPAAEERRTTMQWITVATPSFPMERVDAVFAETGTPDGLEARYVGTADGKVRIVAIWETRAHADRFFAQTLPPALVKALGPEPAGAPTSSASRSPAPMSGSRSPDRRP